MNMFTGAATAIITPFKNGKINYNKLEGLIEWQIRQQIDGIVIAGTTGEASTLSEDEHKEIIKFSVDKINGRVPVIAGTGSNNTEHCLKMSIYAEEKGADALLIVTPYYNKTTQTGIIKHYTYIADRVNIPIIIYNVPGRTGFHISADSVSVLSKHRNICGLKEASGNIAYVAEVASKVDNDFFIYSGNDNMIIPILSLGGKGVISVLSNVLPFETHQMVKKYMMGNVDEAKKLQLKYLDFINALFSETNPIPVKTCLNLLGKDAGELRMPLCDMTEKNMLLLKKEMKNLGMEYM